MCTVAHHTTTSPCLRRNCVYRGTPHYHFSMSQKKLCVPWHTTLPLLHVSEETVCNVRHHISTSPCLSNKLADRRRRNIITRRKQPKLDCRYSTYTKENARSFLLQVHSVFTRFVCFSLELPKNIKSNFDILLTLHLNIFILILTNLMH